MSDVQNSAVPDGPRSARLLGHALGSALKPLFWLVNPLARRGYTTFAFVVLALEVCVAAGAAGYGLVLLAPDLPVLLMPPVGLVGGLLALVGKFGVFALVVTAPFWIVGGFLQKSAGRAAVQQ